MALALLAGCGGGDDPAATPPSASEEAAGQLRIAALGDSITAGSPGFDPVPAQRVRLGFGEDERSQYGYWAERADPELDVRNCGVFGERTDEIALRLGDCAADADVLIVQGGINDIAQGLGAGGRAGIEAIGAAAGNLDAMAAHGQRLGLRVAIAEVLPWNNGHPLADSAITQLNERIADIARRRDLTLLRFHDALEDPDDPGLMRPGLTVDGDHPSIAGYEILGELVATELR